MPELRAKRDATADRLAALLVDYGKSGAWRAIDAIRADPKAVGIEPWPSWCFLPASAVLAIHQAARGGGELPPMNASVVQAEIMLAAWRPTQGIYRFDDTIREMLCAMPLAGEIPTQVLYAMPEWCVYIECARTLGNGERILGFFAHLDSVGKATHLRLTFDLADGPLKMLPIVAAGTVEESIAEMKRDHAAWLADHPGITLPMEMSYTAEDITPLVNLLLYLCSANADMQGRAGDRPLKPRPTRTKKGDRLFPADQPKIWECGYRIGRTIRAALERERGEDQGGSHARPRAHIRRPHWHHFRIGPIASPNRPLVLHWLPPIPVNADYGEVVPTIHRVKA